MREAARELSRVYGRAVMAAEGERAPEVVFAPSRDLSAAALAEALTRACLRAKLVEELPEARVKPLVTIEEMMDQLAKRVQSAMALSFNEFSKRQKNE